MGYGASGRSYNDLLLRHKLFLQTQQIACHVYTKLLCVCVTERKGQVTWQVM